MAFRVLNEGKRVAGTALLVLEEVRCHYAFQPAQYSSFRVGAEPHPIYADRSRVLMVTTGLNGRDWMPWEELCAPRLQTIMQAALL